MSNFNFRENLDFLLVIVLGVCLLTITIYISIQYPRVTVRYDCSIAEISPHYPIAVKEGCRKLRAENILNKPK